MNGLYTHNHCNPQTFTSHDDDVVHLADDVVGFTLFRSFGEIAVAEQRLLVVDGGEGGPGGGIPRRSLLR